MMKGIPLIELMPGQILQVLAEKAVWEIEKKWFEAYCFNLKEKSGKQTLGGFKWHVFSFGYYPCLDDFKALEEYSKQKAISYYVIPEFKTWPKEVAFITDELPPSDLVKIVRDFYVFPKNLAWTMAFTHEYGWLGPYFAKHRDYEKLNRKNMSAIEAKAKNW